MITLWLALACTGEEPEVEEEPVHPVLLGGEGVRERVLARLDREAYGFIWERVESLAAREHEDDGNWETGPNGRNAEAAMANALKAWLHDDTDAADKAIDFLERLETDFWRTEDWDANIRVPATTINHALAVDLLLATEGIDEGDLALGIENLLDVTDEVHARYIEDEIFRLTALYYSQNNHPIRTATSMVVPGLLFQDDPRAADWLDWGLGELEYLLGANGQYIQPDGGVSEGPAYYSFAHGAMIPTLIAAHNALDADDLHTRTCITRNDADPWTDHGCVDGESFAFDNPLDSDRLVKAAEWWITVQLPWGDRPPYEDGRFGALTGGALLSSFGGGGHLRWSWETSRDRPTDIGYGLDGTAWHLAWWDDEIEATEPPWTNRFMDDAGVAVFRSDWSHDAVWGLLIAEHGSVRKTLHDHVDSLSFTLAAYGEYLLMDPGYYKPNELANALTSAPEAHNVVLIDGKGAPSKGLLEDFGDTDAFLGETLDAEGLAYAEARQTYEDTDLTRSVVFVDESWFVIADRLSTERTDAREHAWRMSGWAGRESGGTFTLREDGATWERTAAGVAVHLAATETGLEVTQPPYEEGQAPYVDEVGGSSNGSTHHEVIDGVVEAVSPGFLAAATPYRVGDAPIEVTELDAGEHAAAFLVTGPDSTDVLWLRSEGAAESLEVEDTVLESTAELVVHRLEGPEPFTLQVDGESVSLAGR